MTAILKELRLLEAEHAQGRISDADLKRRRAELMRGIPDAFEVANAPDTPKSKPVPTNNWDMLLILVGVAFLGGALVLLVAGDIVMAMTFGVTVLAALTIRLFLSLDD